VNDVEVHPLTPERWKDFERLFRGGPYVGTCWCMFWRSTRNRFNEGLKDGGKGNRRDMKDVVGGGDTPGILAYVDGEPAAWCSIAPRESYGSLERSRRYPRIDRKPVWSIVCFYIPKEHRGRALMAALLEGAMEHARAHGASLIEAYPVEPDKKIAPGDAYMGVRSAFEQAGFREVARAPNGRPVMRRALRARVPARRRR
jgi:GNAT superfamily N-acetyltransferase